MKRLFLKKFLTLLTCFMLITATSMALAAEVPDEGTVEPRIVAVGAEEFTRGWYAVA